MGKHLFYRMNRLKATTLLLHIASLCLLIPGLVQDMLQINISASFIIELNLFKENRSILGTLSSLWESANYFPFTLIFLFGIIVPVVKSILVFVVLLTPQMSPSYHRFIGIISKWAMADVFAISIFTAFLGANAMENTKAVLQPGFYWFAGYVLLSAVTTAMLDKILRQTKQDTVTHSSI